MSPPLPLAGQSALVTGAARRVGAQIARTLHAAGANVMIHCHRSLDEAQRLAAELNAQRDGSAAVACADLCDTQRLPALVAQTCERFGGLNLLINNASSFYPTPLGSITLQQWHDLMGSNLQAPLFLAQAAAPQLRRHRGSLLNIVDIHGLRPLREHVLYSTAKAGLIMLTRALARELAPEVRVNAIAPGLVKTDFARALWEPNEEATARMMPMKRLGEPADIGNAAVFLASDAASWITGQTLAVDGGLLIRS